jgi:allophanate hydrolase
MGGPDPDHPWSRPDAAGTSGLPAPGALRLGLPTPGGLEFFGDTAMREAHLTARARAVATLRAGTVDVDLDPFVEAGSLLYGPWVAERYADLGEFIASHPDSVVPVVREIIMGGTRFSAPELFRAQHRLKELRHLTGKVWQDVDALVLPTVGTTFTVEEVLADPISRNTALGRYTQFANLLNLAAVSVPAGTTADGRPVALMVLGPARSDLLLAGIAATLLGETLLGETRPTGPSGETRPSGPSGETRPSGPSGEAPNEVPAPLRADVTIAVAGRHLSVGTRNRELLERGARLLETTTTSAEYRLYALPPADDPLPGLLPAGSGGPIEVELWSLPAERLADLLLQVPVPLYLGRLHLADGREVLGFLADGHAVRTAEESGEATDITATGGWRYYRSPAPTSSTHPEGRS